MGTRCEATTMTDRCGVHDLKKKDYPEGRMCPRCRREGTLSYKQAKREGRVFNR